MKHATLALLFLLAGASAVHSENWPNWRGPNQDGSSTGQALPEKFSKTEGVKWAADVPGISASCPVVWGDHVFLTAPVPAEQKLVGLCYDAKTGREKWRQVIAEGSKWDDKSNLASPSPTTDGERVVFLFANAQAACFDLAGKKIWERDLTKTHGAFATQWTYGSSPLLDGGKLYIQVLQRNEVFDFQGFQKGTPGKDMRSYILALDPATGKDIWKHVRETNAQAESLEAFSSPVLTTHNGRRLLLISGGDVLTCHDADSGTEIWRSPTWNLPGDGYRKDFRLVPSPVAGDGIALVCAPKKNAVYAAKLDSKGTLTEKDLAWISDPKVVTSDVSTPLFYQGRFYILNSDRNLLSCVEPKTGKVIWTGELTPRPKIESSCTAGDGKIYAVNFWGDVFVVKAGDKFELLHTAEMGDGSKPGGNEQSVRASVAIANGCLFIRAQDKLYCIAK